METLPQAEHMPTFARQHANGEVFTAPNLEVARSMCPVLGKMTLEESGLLMELQAMGQAQMAEQPNAPHEKPRIKKIEKQQPDRPDIDRVVLAVADSSQKPTVAHQTHDLEKFAVVTRSTLLSVEPSIVRAPPTKEAVKAASIDITATSVREMSIPATAKEIKFIQRPAPTENFQLQTAMRLQETVPRPTERAEQIVAKPVALAGQATRIAAITKPPNEAVNSRLTEPPRPTKKLAIPDAIAPAPPVINEAAEVTEHQLDEDLLNADETALYPIVTKADEAEVRKANEQFLAQTVAEEVPEDAPQVPLSVEAQNAPAVPELPAPIEHIETAITDLAEALEVADQSETEQTHVIIEKIIAVSDVPEQIIDSPEGPADQQLEALFVELFDEAHIAYTPELVNSFAQLTRAHYRHQRLKITPKTKEPELPTEPGTHEFLQKLQRGLIAVKQSINNVYELGKSVLRAYNLGAAVPQGAGHTRS